MNYFDDAGDQEYYGHESAILEALQKTDKGLFDVDYSIDEDLEALKSN